jgi:hypothetical protein
VEGRKKAKNKSSASPTTALVSPPMLLAFKVSVKAFVAIFLFVMH